MPIHTHHAQTVYIGSKIGFTIFRCVVHAGMESAVQEHGDRLKQDWMVSDGRKSKKRRLHVVLALRMLGAGFVAIVNCG